MAQRATTVAPAPERRASQATGLASRPDRPSRTWLLLVATLVPAMGLALFFLSQDRKKNAVKDDPRAQKSVLEPAAIDGERALGYLNKICELGPRIAGSEPNTQQREMVAAHFGKYGGKVREQPFAGINPMTGERVAMVNLIGSWFPDRKERIVIGAHYDTRPFPDREQDPVAHNQPFLGANDGASGVALLMELAHHLSEMNTPWGVDLVLFDGEELVYDRLGEYFLGSREFARQYKQDRRSRKIDSVYVAGIVLDMVGGKNLRIPKEPKSVQYAGRLSRELWIVAQRLGAKAFVDRLGPEVLDDHLALNEVGIPSVDIIDFSYEHWHLASDLPEQCSASSLSQVGRVVSAWLALPRTPAAR